jgi:DNA-binding MarR family transcriptional regulator
VRTTSSTTDIAHRLRFAIARTARRMRQEAGAELSPSQLAALATIERHGPVTPSELATHERIQRPSVTRMLARFEEAGLVARTPDPHDGRSSLIALTPAALAMTAELRTRKTAYLARHIEDLSAEDRAVLDKAAHVLERMLGE